MFFHFLFMFFYFLSCFFLLFFFIFSFFPFFLFFSFIFFHFLSFSFSWICFFSFSFSFSLFLNFSFLIFFLFFICFSLIVFLLLHLYQGLTKDVSSVVGAPWRCGVLTTYGGLAGIGLGRLLGGGHDSTPQSGVEAPRLLKRSLSRLYCCCCFRRFLMTVYVHMKSALQ